MTTRRVRPQLPGVVLSVHDGDGAILLVRVATDPHRLWAEVDGRLTGYNARELEEPGGFEAYEYLGQLLPRGTEVTVTLHGPDKYGGRTLISVQLADGRDVATEMITSGYAARWNGKGPKPVPPWPIPTPES